MILKIIFIYKSLRLDLIRLILYNTLLDSGVEIECNGVSVKINKVSYTDFTVEETQKQITIIGDQSPDQDGTIKKKIIKIKQKDNDMTIFNFECEYSGSFFMGSVPYIFKVYKHTLNQYCYNRY